MKKPDVQKIMLILLIIVYMALVLALLQVTYYSNMFLPSKNCKCCKCQESVQSSLVWKYVDIY